MSIYTVANVLVCGDCIQATDAPAVRTVVAPCDTPQHCAHCAMPMDVPLSRVGADHVADTIVHDRPFADEYRYTYFNALKAHGHTRAVTDGVFATFAEGWGDPRRIGASSTLRAELDTMTLAGHVPTPVVIKPHDGPAQFITSAKPNADDTEYTVRTADGNEYTVQPDAIVWVPIVDDDDNPLFRESHGVYHSPFGTTYGRPTI